MAGGCTAQLIRESLEHLYCILAPFASTSLLRKLFTLPRMASSRKQVKGGRADKADTESGHNAVQPVEYRSNG